MVAILTILFDLIEPALSAILAPTFVVTCGAIFSFMGAFIDLRFVASVLDSIPFV